MTVHRPSGLVPAIALAGLLLAACQAAEPSPSPSATPTPTPTPVPTEQALNQELLSDRFSVLLVGLDTSEVRSAAASDRNADALMVASLSADQSELTLISLPRDTVDVPTADGGVWDSKINGLYAAEGIDALTGALGALYGIELDGHVALNMDDFATLVDAVGGISVDPETPLFDPPIALDLQAGEQEVDGQTALAYVRTRVDQDYGRIGRQQEVIQTLVAELVDPGSEVDLPELIAGLDEFETDLPLEDLPTLVELARRAQDANVSELIVGPPELIVFEGDRGDGRGYILEPDVEAIRAEVAELIGPE